MLKEIHVGDVVRVDGEPQPWRVEARTRKGMLTLEALHAVNRMTWSGVHEFRVVKGGVF
ncbi:MAG: hypothetical protein WDA07_05495 [Leucobacter sp.]